MLTCPQISLSKWFGGGKLAGEFTAYSLFRKRMSGDTLNPHEAIALEEENRKTEQLRAELVVVFQQLFESMTGDFGKDLLAKGIEDLKTMDLAKLKLVKAGKLILVDGGLRPAGLLSELNRMRLRNAGATDRPGYQWQAEGDGSDQNFPLKPGEWTLKPKE